MSCRTAPWDCFEEEFGPSFPRSLVICHLHIPHNATYLPPNIVPQNLHNLLLGPPGYYSLPREIENNANAKFWGANKVHYERRASGE